MITAWPVALSIIRQGGRSKWKGKGTAYIYNKKDSLVIKRFQFEFVKKKRGKKSFKYLVNKTYYYLNILCFYKIAIADISYNLTPPPSP